MCLQIHDQIRSLFFLRLYYPYQNPPFSIFNSIMFDFFNFIFSLSFSYTLCDILLQIQEIFKHFFLLFIIFETFIAIFYSKLFYLSKKFLSSLPPLLLKDTAFSSVEFRFFSVSLTASTLLLYIFCFIWLSVFHLSG